MSSVFITVGVHDTPWHPQFFRVPAWCSPWKPVRVRTLKTEQSISQRRLATSFEDTMSLCIENPLKILAALVLQRNTCASCLPRKPLRVRTLQAILALIKCSIGAVVLSFLGFSIGVA